MRYAGLIIFVSNVAFFSLGASLGYGNGRRTEFKARWNIGTCTPEREGQHVVHASTVICTSNGTWVPLPDFK